MGFGLFEKFGPVATDLISYNQSINHVTNQSNNHQINQTIRTKRSPISACDLSSLRSLISVTTDLMALSSNTLNIILKIMEMGKSGFIRFWIKILNIENTDPDYFVKKSS